MVHSLITPIVKEAASKPGLIHIGMVGVKWGAVEVTLRVAIHGPAAVVARCSVDVVVEELFAAGLVLVVVSTLA